MIVLARNLFLPHARTNPNQMGIRLDSERMRLLSIVIHIDILLLLYNNRQYFPIQQMHAIAFYTHISIPCASTGFTHPFAMCVCISVAGSFIYP